MNKSKKTINTILGIFILICIGYGVYLLVIKILGLFSIIKPEILVAIIGGMATIMAGIVAVIINNRYTKQRDIEETHRAKKVEIYKEFLETISKMMAKENKAVTIEKISDQELINYLVKFKTEIILWGSPEVIKCQLQFEHIERENDKVFKATDNLYKAIRKDIGLSNKGLNNFELIKMYLKDPSELDTMMNKK